MAARMSTTGAPSITVCQLERLHEAHPKIRAADWISPLICCLVSSKRYSDGNRVITEEYTGECLPPVVGKLQLRWTGMKKDFDLCVNTYQDAVLTEYAALGLACILLHEKALREITEVTRRGEKADYWL